MNTLKEFEVVLEIASCGSISKAAKKLKIAQPTLSKYLAHLEENLGAELFDRKKSPICLTEIGERYIKAGQQILDVYSQFERDLKKLTSSNAEVLKIGISPTRAHYILPSLIEEFRKRCSDTKLVVKERTTSQLNSELSRGELDLIISLKYDGTRQFEEVSLFSEKVMLAVPKKYEKYDAMYILKECPFINIGAGLRMSDTLLSILREVGAEEPAVEAQSIEAVLALVNRGIGAALAPSYIAKYGTYDNVAFMPLPDGIRGKFDTEIGREVSIFSRKGQILTLSEQAFVDVCRDIVKF